MPLLDRLKRQPTRVRFSLGRYLTRETAILALLLVVTILTTLGMAGLPAQSMARGLFDSHVTDTPDPNSPLETPTEAPTLLPTATEAAIAETATPIPTVAPTTEVPSPTAPSGVVPTAPPPLPIDAFTPTPTPPPAGGVIPPTPTAIPLPAPGLPPPIQTVATISGSIPMTIGVEVPPVEPASAPAATGERAFDLALFIDNFVIALGYIWICCGILFLVAAAIGGVWFLRRPARSRTAPSSPTTPPYQPPPAATQTWSDAAPSTRQPAAPPQPAAPGPDKPRVAARHKQAPPDDFDHPSSP